MYYESMKKYRIIICSPKNIRITYYFNYDLYNTNKSIDCIIIQILFCNLQKINVIKSVTRSNYKCKEFNYSFFNNRYYINLLA